MQTSFPPARSRRRAFTLSEMMVTVGLLSLIGGAFIVMYAFSLRNAARITSSSFAAWDAATALDRVTLALREARRFEFMDNGTTGPVAYQTPANPNNNPNYLLHLQPPQVVNSVDIVTGIHIVFPAARAGVSANLPTRTASLTGADALADNHSDGATLDFYRSDPQGRPAPADGTCLWMRGTLYGSPVPTDPNAAPGIDGKAVATDVAKVAGAVQFVQGQANTVSVKIVTGAYDIHTQSTVGTVATGIQNTNGQMTSDNFGGGVTALTASNVYLRNHDPNGVTAASGSHGKAQYKGN